MLLVARNETARRVIVCAAAVVIGVGSIWLVMANLGTPWLQIEFSSGAIDAVCTVVGVVIAGVVLYFGVKYKNALACILAVVQVVGSLVFELVFAHGIEVQYGLYVDSLSLLMAFIIGVVGSGICVYALGYMEDFQAHEPAGAKDRRPTFFALMFLFLSAMYVIVFSNNLLWLFTGWEITTVCSFLLIGYTRTEEAIRNAFRQIVMNLAGGIGFLVGLYAIAVQFGTLSMLEFLQLGSAFPVLAALPATRACVRGHHEGRADAVPHLAARRHGGTYSHLRAAALFHHGEGRRVSARQAGAHLRGVPGSRGHDHPGGRLDVHAVQLYGHLAV